MSSNQMRTDYPSSPPTTSDAWAMGAILFAAVMMIDVRRLPGDDRTRRAVRERVLRHDAELHVPVRRDHLGMDPPADRCRRRFSPASASCAGNLAARILGIALAVVSAIANFMFIPYYPFWSIAIIALDVFVIWALAAHGHAAVE